MCTPDACGCTSPHHNSADIFRLWGSEPKASLEHFTARPRFTDSFPDTHKNWMGWAIEENPLSMGLKQQAWFFGSGTGSKTTFLIAYPNN